MRLVNWFGKHARGKQFAQWWGPHGFHRADLRMGTRDQAIKLRRHARAGRTDSSDWRKVS